MLHTILAEVVYVTTVIYNTNYMYVAIASLCNQPDPHSRGPSLGLSKGSLGFLGLLPSFRDSCGITFTFGLGGSGGGRGGGGEGGRGREISSSRH